VSEATLTHWARLVAPGLAFVGLLLPQPSFASASQWKAERAFTQCLATEATARGLDDAATKQLLLDKGLGRELFRRIRDSMAPSSWARNGLAAEPADDAAALAVVTPLMTGNVGGEAFIERIQAVAGTVIAQATESDCVVPPHLLPGGDPDRDWLNKNENAWGKANRFDDCVSRASGKLDQRLHAAIPVERHAGIREFVAKAMADDGAGSERRASADAAPTIDILLQIYMIQSVAADKNRSFLRSNLYINDLKNRYLQLGCQLEDAVAVRAAFAIPDAD
jgi:hypothetical protein